MAKILVADDNSNVQKTVALALADLGIEVVSVNNGEAAVRKLPDFQPDLVLADIFMPVRNGYEVCEYIKKDARFARVPVVLLVGAFDPLDEREAQRVGADGILKKPFVPPDPLITMVKTLLERTLGDRLVAVGASKPAVAAQTVTAPVSPVPTRTTATAVAEVHAPTQEISEEPPSPEFPTPIEHVEFGEGNHPVAFSTLLEAPPQDVVALKSGEVEPVDDEQILTSSRDATLGDPIFWKNDSPETEPAPEEVAETPSIPELRTWKQPEDSLPRREETALLQPIEPMELVHEEIEEAAPTVVDSAAILLDQAAQAPLTVESDKALELAANPTEWMASAPAEHSDAEYEPTPGWDEPIPDATHTIDQAESTEEPAVSADVETHASESERPVEPVELSTPVVPEAAAPDPVVKKEEIPVAAMPEPAATLPEPAVPELPSSAPNRLHIALSPAAQSAADTARSIPKQDWADLTASLRSSATELVSQQIKSEPIAHVEAPAPTSAEELQAAPPGSVQEHTPDPALVEAVVQRVLDKMRPQVVDIITKEFLRPIVQALVHREIEKN